MKDANFKNRVLSLLAKNQTEKAIETCMDTMNSNSTHYKSLIVISSNFHKWKNDNMMGLNPATADLNRITLSIMSLVDDYVLFNPKESENISNNIVKDKAHTTDNKRHILNDKQDNSRSSQTDYEYLIKKKAQKEYPNDFEMQKFFIDNQMNAFRKLSVTNHSDIPENILQFIRNKAKLDYSDDFIMQEHVLNQQIESYRELQAAKPNNISDTVWQQIKQYAEQQYPNDFQMQNYIRKEQVASFRKNNTIKPNDVPQNILISIFTKAKKEYPSDYSMQNYVIEQQIQAYRELN